jgi:hypothetical protein
MDEVAEYTERVKALARRKLEKFRARDESLKLEETSSLRQLIGKGWRITYAELFGTFFVESLAPHHIEAIEWHWNSRMSFLHGGHPDYLAYFPIWSRGNMKSMIAEHLAVVDCILSTAFGKISYILYVCSNKDKVQEHINNIESILSSEKVKEYCPRLSTPKRTDTTNQQRRWTSTFLHTDVGSVIQGGTLDSGLAGSRVEKTRPTFIIPDDIDRREDSPVISESRFRQLTSEVLPMRQENTLVFFAQNLISKYSVMYRIQKGQEKVLTNRKPTNPIPAVFNLVTEERLLNGVVQDVYVSGTPSWHVWTAQRIQDEISTEGLPAFLRECQHEVEQSRVGLILYNYNDAVHPVSYSQFASVFGSRSAWKDWYKVLANDYARTKTKFHANVAGYFCVSSQNTALPGHTFLIPMSFKANTAPEDMADRFLSMLQPYAYQKTTWNDLIHEAWKRLNPNQHFDTVLERMDYLKSFYSQIIPRYSRPVLSGFNVRAAVISHSEDKLRMSLNAGFGFGFTPSNPGKNDGIEDMNGALKVDHNASHCFDKSKNGYTRFHVLCEDDLTAEPTLINGVLVYPPVPFRDDIKPDDLHDADLFRYQMLNCRNRDPKLTEAGEVIDDPEKMNDDFKQMWQMVVFKNLLRNIKLNNEEQFAAHLQANAPNLTPEAIDSAPLEVRSQRRASYMMEREEFFHKKGKNYEKGDSFAEMIHEQGGENFDWLENL